MAAFASPPRRSFWKKNAPFIFICCIVSLVAFYGVFVMKSYTKLRQSHQETNAAQRIPSNNNKDGTFQQQQSAIKSLNKKKKQPQCTFREYPKRRYYGLAADSSPLPDFLKDAEYIYGKLPILLNVETASQVKLYVNQTEWKDEPSSARLPFADGTNPSLLSLERIPLLNKYEGATYLATICMTNSLCSWNDSSEEKEQYKISSLTKPATVRTLLLWLNDNFETLHQTTVYLERDAQWGGKRTPSQKNKDGSFVQDVRALDDARLFVHNNAVWISYRDGPNFGYDKQVLNPIHFQEHMVIIKASESVPFCCGRNMALLEHSKTKKLQSLTWADPVTVIDVNVDVAKTARRRLTQDFNTDNKNDTHRRLGKRRESHFHGTNAFLVPYKDELLGIGHFHRPPDREKNDYSRHGHHYTHAFFTISSTEPYHLLRLSAEFVFPSKQYPQDAAIIQFASGLELDEANGKTVIAYGINDCEGASVYVDLKVVEEMLLPVKDGQQVVDLMRKVES